MSFDKQTTSLANAIEAADAILVGAGAGLSTAAGLTYSGERFKSLFGDFAAKYGIRDMYSGGFFPFPTPEEQWAWWSRHIWCNRYEKAAKRTYEKLLKLLEGLPRACAAQGAGIRHLVLAVHDERAGGRQART